MQLISEYSQLLIIPILVISGLLAWILYIKNKNEEFAAKWKIILFTIRFLIFSLIGLLLINPMIRSTEIEKSKPELIILTDHSSSMTQSKDSAFIKSELKEIIEDFKNGLSDKFSIKEYGFSNKFSEPDFKFEGSSTDFGSIISQTTNSFKFIKSGAVVFISDGINNQGSNPVYAAQNLNLPIYTLGTGDTTIYKDLSINQVNFNEIAFLGNSFPVEIELLANKCIGNKTELSIYENDIKINSQIVNITSDHFTSKQVFILTAKKLGLVRYKIIASSLSQEKNTRNNQASFVVDIIDTKQKILVLYDAPHPDVGAIKSSLEQYSDFETELADIKQFNKNLSAYNLVILIQLPATSRQSTEIFTKIKASNIPYFLIGGQQTNYMYLKNLNQGFTIQNNANQYNDASAIYKSEFSLFTVDEDFMEQISDFPPLRVPYGEYKLSPSFEYLFTQKIGATKTEIPLLAISGAANMKRAVLFGEGLWRWRMRDYLMNQSTENFDQMIEKIVRFLCITEEKNRFSVNCNKLFNESEDVIFDARLFNKSYELVNKPELNLTIKDENGKIYSYTFNKTENHYQLNAGSFLGGKYYYTSKVSLGDEKFETKGYFVVREWDMENSNTIAQHDLLKQISFETKGNFFEISRINDLQKELLKNENFASIRIEHEKFRDLIDLRFYFALIILLLTIEWFFRKRLGSY